jgi:TolA-binding protein
MASNTEQIVPSSQSKTFKKQQNPDNHESYALSKMKTPLIDHASRGRFPSQSASGFRRALAGDTSPPILSSSYSLAFARRLNISSNIDINEGNISQCSSSNLCGDATKREIKSAPITSSASSLSSSSSSKTIVCEQKDKLRPSSTPSPVRNASNHLETMASIYNGVPVFVEALPISVRISEVAQGNGSPYYKRNRLEMKSAGYIRHSPLKEQSHLRGNTVNTSNITQDSTGDSELLDILQGMDVGAEKMSPHNNQKKTVDLSLKRPTTCGASRPNDDENGLHQKYNARSQCEHQRPATASCSLLHSKGSVVKNVSGTFQGSAKVPSKDRGEDLDGDDDPKILQQAQEEYTRGLQHQKDGNLAKAIECYEKALCMKGTHQFSALYINLGSVYMCQREYEQALWSFERAEEIQPGNVKAIYNMALALSRLGKPVEAQEKFTRVLKLDPMHENAMRALNLANEDVV